jgi:hypothetical protein
MDVMIYTLRFCVMCFSVFRDVQMHMVRCVSGVVCFSGVCVNFGYGTGSWLTLCVMRCEPPPSATHNAKRISRGCNDS